MFISYQEDLELLLLHFPHQCGAGIVCVYVCVCVCTCVFVRRNVSLPVHSTYKYCPPLQGQYLQFILFCKITLSQRLSISLPVLLLLPPSSGSPPPSRPPPPPSQPPVTSTVRFSAAEHDRGQLRRPLSMRGHPVEAIHYRQLVPNHLSPPAICVHRPPTPPTPHTLSLHPRCSYCM